jgi:hypothetical protein
MVRPLTPKTDALPKTPADNSTDKSVAERSR